MDLSKATTDVAALQECVADLVNQFAYWGNGGFTTGGLSALEDAFKLLGYGDFIPAPDQCCDEPGCKAHGSMGWPTKEGGYRVTCWAHKKPDGER